MLEKQKKRIIRHKRIRAKIFGTKQIPRLCVFRSNKHLYAQIILDDNEKSKTLISVSDFNLKLDKSKKLKEKYIKAYEIGKLIAERALEKKIKKVVFDRGGYKYHGNIKALADGAKDNGLEF